MRTIKIDTEQPTFSVILMNKAKIMMTNKLSRTPTYVVKDADSSDDDVDDLQCNVTDVGKIPRQIIVFRRGCRDVISVSLRASIKCKF